MMNITEIILGPEKNLIEPSLHYLSEVAEKYGLKGREIDNFKSMCRKVLFATQKQNRKSDGRIRIQIGPDKEVLNIVIQNDGTPLFENDLIEISSGESSQCKYTNKGRLGQEVEFSIPLNAAQLALETNAEPPDIDKGLNIRAATFNDALTMSTLFYDVYGYRYINDYVYFPEKLAMMIAEKKLLSIIAENKHKEIVGHIGLLKLNDSPLVYDAALGAVAPLYNGTGIFSKIFNQVMELSGRTPMSYCVYDFVTNHDFSQRMVAKYGYCELAILLGSQVSYTQAKLETLGIGKDAQDMDRYTMLTGVGVRTPAPFGKTLILPTNIGEALGFLLKPMGITWVPAPRFYPLSQIGDFGIKLQPEQKAVIFDLFSPGREAVLKIIERFKKELKDGAQYVAVDVPLDAPGIGQIYDLLAKQGFFMAGFIPYHFSNRLGFRFQFLTPTNLSFDSIKMFSETGKKLLSVIRENYERNKVF